MNLLERYTIRSLLIGFSLVAVVLLGLMSLFDLAQRLEDVGKGNYRFNDALWHTALCLPRQFVELAPFIALLGGLVGLGLLNVNHELTAMTAAGMRPVDIVRATLMAAAVLALIQAVGDSWLAPMGEQAALSQERALKQANVASESGFWARDGNQILRIGGLRHGRIPVDIELFELDGDNQLRRYVYAREAAIRGPDLWVFQDVSVKRFSGTGREHESIEALNWKPFLDADQIRTLSVPAEALSIVQLRGYVEELRDSGRDAERYRVMLWRKPGALLLTLIMGVLAVPFASGGSPRSGLAPRLAIGALSGIGVFIADELLALLGSRLDLPAAVIGFAPAFALAAVVLPVSLGQVGCGYKRKHDPRHTADHGEERAAAERTV